jgi:hypothetical protein
MSQSNNKQKQLDNILAFGDPEKPITSSSTNNDNCIERLESMEVYHGR